VRVGTKSVLYGAHCFFLHPWFVALAWWKLFGFPWSPILWVSFFVHDLGYFGKTNMDGPEGEEHPKLGGQIMTTLFDEEPTIIWQDGPLRKNTKDYVWVDGEAYGKWGQFSLLHSRYYAKALGLPFSRLCVADKLSFPLTPRWLYLPAVCATGEIREYLNMAKNADTKAGHWKAADYSQDLKLWHSELCAYMTKWVAEHRDMKPDTWTSTDRHARSDSGVWQ
jgi:hypothetical protein